MANQTLGADLTPPESIAAAAPELTASPDAPVEPMDEWSTFIEVSQSDGLISVEKKADRGLQLSDIVEEKAGESFVIAPTVVERGPGYRVIESITRIVGKGGEGILKTNRYSIRGELAGEESLPGVRRTVLKEPHVMELGEHHKIVESVSEYLDPSGARLVTTNRFVKLDSPEALAEFEKPQTLERSAHQKRVRQNVTSADGEGNLRFSTTTYTELGVGLAYQDENGEWQDSVAEFETTPEGDAVVARRTQHKVFLKANPNEDDPVQITLPDGTVLKSRVLGLGYFDRTSGQSVIIASLQAAAGELNAAKNEVSFPHAFRGIDATLRFVLTAAGIEQDVILHEQPAAPEEYDKSFRPETSDLQVITEFFPSRDPEIRRMAGSEEKDLARRATMVEPELTDELIQFGSMYIGPGRAFSLERDQANSEVRVMKQWQVIDGRTILFEAVPYPELKPLMEKLPAVRLTDFAKPRAALGRQLPGRLQAKLSSGTKAIRLARNDQTRRGVVLDYSLQGSASGVTFQNGITYLIKSLVTLNNTTIQGGSFIKAAPGSSLTLSGNVTCQASASSKAYFVAMNDNSVGATIVAGAPVATVAGTAINLYNANNGTTLSHLEIRNAGIGVDVYSAGVMYLNNLRIVDCTKAIRGYNSTVDTTGGVLSRCGGAEWENSGNANYVTNAVTIVDCRFCSGDATNHGIGSALAIPMNSTASGVINCVGDEDFNQVVVGGTNATVLLIHGVNSPSIYAHLLDSNGFELTSAGPGNFDLYRAVTPGTYYVRVRGGDASSYELTMNQVSGLPLVTTNPQGGLRRDLAGWAGFQFTVGTTPIMVTELARYVISGNARSHLVKLVQADGADLPNVVSQVTIATSGKPVGFAYAPFPAPVVLEAERTYALISQEENDATADQWLDYLGNSISLDAVANNASSAWSYSLPAYNVMANGGNKSYVPVNLLYRPAAGAAWDDHGNSITNATLVAENGSVAGVINYAGDQDYFRIVLSSAGTITAYTGGDTDTVGELLDSAGLSLSPSVKNDDFPGHPFPNFWLSYNAPAAGTYYIRAKHYAGNGTGQYTLYVQSTVAGRGNLVASVVPGGYLRNNFSGWVGLGFTVGSSPITVREAGRWVVSGNNQAHALKLVDINGSILGQTTVNMAGQAAGQFAYGSLFATLTANTYYMLLSQEASGLDLWYHDYNTKVALSSVASVPMSVYQNLAPPPLWVQSPPGICFGPVDLRFDVTTLPTPSLSASFTTDHSQATVSAAAQLGFVYYTTDGSDPTQLNSTTPPVLSSAATVKARAFLTGYSPSGIASYPVGMTLPVSFNPNGHNPLQYASGPINVTMTAEAGATIAFQPGTGSWSSTSSGAAPLIDGIGNGNGTIQAYAYTATKLRSSITPSAQFSFRLPQPTSTATYGTAHTTGTLTLANAVVGAELRYTTDGVTLPTAASTLYSGPLNLTAATKVLARAYKAGYIPSGAVSAWVSQLPPARLATSTGLVTTDITVANDLDICLVPNFGFANAYGENRDMSGWYYGNVAWNSEAPTANYPGSFFGGVQNNAMVYSMSFVPVSFGRTYSLAGWYRKDLAGTPCDHAGLYNQSDDGSPIFADDVNEFGYAPTYLTAVLVDGATTAQVADATTFNQVPQPGESYFNIFTPLVNFSSTGPIQRANQPNSLSQIYQPMDSLAAAPMKVLAVNGNVLTLQNAYHGPSLPVGTPVARRQAGSWYQYELFVCTTLPTTWSYFSKPFTYLRAGTESVRLLNLLYSGATRFSGQEFWEGGVADRPNLYYTLNGNTAVFTSGAADPGPKKITLNAATTISLGQRGTYYIDSPVLQRTITFKVAAPQLVTTLNSAGTLLTIVPSTATVGAAIYYTTDGTEPTTASTLYSAGTAGVSFAPTVTTKWKAFRAGYLNSDTVTQPGVPAAGQVAQPIAQRLLSPPLSGIKQVKITASTTTTPQDIRYTTDNSEPAAAGISFPASGELLLPAALTVKLKAFKAGLTPSVTTVSVNQPPTLTFGQGTGNAYADQLAGFEYLLFVQPSGGTGSLTDQDSYNFGYGELRVQMTSPTTSDQFRCHPSRNGLTFVPSPIPNADPNIVPGEIKDGGVRVGIFVGGYNGTPLVMTFDVNASTGLQQDVLLGIGYRYSGTVGSSTARQFSVTASDGDGGTTSLTGTLNVVPSQGFTVTVDPHSPIEISQAAQLKGYLNGKLPVPGNGLTAVWSVLTPPAGGGTATFDYSAAKVTSATFSKPGVYVLRYTVAKPGSSGYADLSLTVNDAPAVNIQYPTEGDQRSANTAVTLTASAAVQAVGASISTVQFFRGTLESPVLIGSGTYSSGSYQFVWANPTVGIYGVFAKATDSAGRMGYSALRSFRVGAFPIVNLTAPTANAVFTPAATVTMSANVSETGGKIDRLELLEGNTLIDAEIVPANTDVSSVGMTASKGNWKPGNYTLMARGTDRQNPNLKAISALIPISVKNSTASANGRWIPIFGVADDLNGGIDYGYDGHPAYFQALQLVPDAASGNQKLYLGKYFPHSGDLLTSVSEWLGDRFARRLECNQVAQGEECPQATGVRDLKRIGDYLYVTYDRRAIYLGANVRSRPVGGTTWTKVGNQLIRLSGGVEEPASVNTIAGLGNSIYVGGDFVKAADNTSLSLVAKLSASGTSWVNAGSGLPTSAGTVVRALTALNGNLIAGGNFSASSGGLNRIASLSAQGSWQPMASGLNGEVYCLLVHKGLLYVGGSFTATTDGLVSGLNGIAVWNGSNWSSVGEGVWNSAGGSGFSGLVRALAARGDELFVAGRFDQIGPIGSRISVGQVARATWNRTEEGWKWSPLGFGASNPQIGGSLPDGVAAEDTVLALAVRDSGASGYELFAAGNFQRIDGMETYYAARWVSGAEDINGAEAPQITLTASQTEIQYTTTPIPGIILGATASTLRSGSSIEKVDFFCNGEIISGATDITAPYSASWAPPGPGIFQITASAKDTLSPYRTAVSAAITVVVRQISSGPMPLNDAYGPFFVDASIPVLNVLANDQNATRITRVFRPSFPAFAPTAQGIAPLNPPASGGSLQITPDGKALRYFPNLRSCGKEVFAYEVTDGAPTPHYATATVTITVVAKPEVQITTADNQTIAVNTPFVISGEARDADGKITKVQLFRDGVQQGADIDNPSPTFSFPSWSSSVPARYTFFIRASDGTYTRDSAPITVNIRRTSSPYPPVGSITELVNSTTPGGPPNSTNYPTLRNSTFVLKGTASDQDDPVSYQVLLYRPDQPKNILANVTPTPNGQGFHIGGDVAGSLQEITLPPVPNGIYDLALVVYGGGEYVIKTVRVALDVGARLGRLSFSEEDLVIPTAGIPLRVARTYDSGNPFSGDFGPGWTYDLLDLDAVSDEIRETRQAVGDIDSSAADVTGLPFSLRIGGGYNLTLNLPGGRRGTFLFTPWQGDSGLHAHWDAPPGSGASLKILNGSGIPDNTSELIYAVPYLRWGLAQLTAFEHFDIPQYELTTEDGTKYVLTRQLDDAVVTTYVYSNPNPNPGSPTVSPVQPRSGKLKVTQITRPSGETISINAQGTQIDFKPSESSAVARSLSLDRDTKGRIIGVRDSAATLATPSVRYIYNEDTGNLWKVQKLVDRAGSGTYATTTYRCENSSFPSYITSIDDPRGMPMARTEYFDASVNLSDAAANGRIKSITDAKGRKTTFAYPASGFESGSMAKSGVTVTDPEGNVTMQEFDEFGNVILAKNALLFTTKRTFQALPAEPSLPTKETFGTQLAPGGPVTTLTREWKYEDGDYKFAPSTITALFSGTPQDADKPRTVIDYNRFGQTLKVVEPNSVANGSTASRSYSYAVNDTTGAGHRQLLTETFTGIDPVATAQVLTENSYDAIGRLDWSRDANNTYTKYVYYTGAPGQVGKHGDLITVEVHEGSLSGPTLSKVTYEYDAASDPLGNRTKQIVERSGGGPDVTWFYYDAQGRLIQQKDPTGATSETQHNLIGKVAVTTDRYSAVTRYFYDRVGDQTCVRYTDGTVTLTATFYDTANGERQVIVTDRHFRTANNQTTTGTRTIYDKVGRPRQVEKLSGIPITESTSLAINSSTDVNLICDTAFNTAATAPTVLSFTATTYYKDGRVASTTDANSQATTYEYSADGLTRITRPPAYVENGSTVTTEVVDISDVSGNLIRTQTRSYSGGVLQGHRPETRFYYDQMNRQVRQRIALNESVPDNRTSADGPANGDLMAESAFDWTGRKWLEVDADRKGKAFVYDGLGRLSWAVTDVNVATAVLSGGDAGTYATGFLNPSAGNNAVKLTAKSMGTAPNGTVVMFVEDGQITGNTATISYDATGLKVSIRYSPTLTTAQTIVSAVNGVSALNFSAALDSAASGDSGNTGTGLIGESFPRVQTIFTDRANWETWAKGFRTASESTATQYTFDEAGNLRTQIDAAGSSTTFEYDTLGRRTKRTLPAGGAFEQWEYDFVEPNGPSSTATKRPNVVRHKDFLGQYLTRVYDSMGRLTDEKENGVSRTSFEYSPSGLRSKMIDNKGLTDGNGVSEQRTTEYAYDQSSRLKVKQMPEGTLSYSYDFAGNVTEVSVRHGYTFSGSQPWDFNSASQSANTRTVGAHMSYDYDNRSRLSKVFSDPSKSSSTLRATYSFDPVGNVGKVTFAKTDGTAAATTSYSYNARNQLRFVQTVSGTAGATLASFDYDDADGGDSLTWPATRTLATSGQRRGVREVIPTGGGTYPRLVGYNYDSLHRLTRESLLSGAFAAATGYVQYDGAVGYSDNTGYDRVGNRQQRTVNNLSGVAQRTYSPYDANDRLGGVSSGKVGATWNANGNTLRSDINADGAVDQSVDDTYDFNNRLKMATRTVGAIRMVYDGDGNRVRKTVGGTAVTCFLVDDRNPTGYAQVLEESGTAGGTPTVGYVYGLDLINQDRSGTTKYYGYDGLGSVRYLVDNAGAATGDTYTYDSFGIQIASNGSTINNYRYAGEQWDPDLGMYYLRARYYQPEIGRFWTMDSAEGGQDDPLSLHKYLYASVDPINRVDPSGLESLVGVSAAMTIGNSLHAIYDGVVGGVGGALQGTIQGVQAGKGINDILTSFVLDETGLGLVVAGYDALKDYFQDGETAALVAYQAWQEEVVAAIVMSIPNNQYGEFDVEFVPQCFAAGTLIATEDRVKPIEQIAPGDRVWAWNSVTDDVALQRVLRQFVHLRDKIVVLRVGRDELNVTPEHPFLVRGSGWTPACDIYTGDEIATLDGAYATVEGKDSIAGKIRVYNFEVEQDHNYFVGIENLLTHNVGAAQMRRTLGIGGHSLLAAHHIVARFAKNADNQASILLLKSVGISLEHGANGVALPRNLKIRVSSAKFGGYAAHSVIHTAKYYENVKKELEMALALGGRRQVRLQLQSIGQRLRLGVFP